MADLFWAGFIGSRAVATVGVAQSWIVLFITATMGLDTGARAMVSRAIGAGDLAAANRIARQSLFVSGATALTVMGFGIVLSDFLLRLLGVTENMVEEGSTYQRIRLASAIFFTVNNGSGSLLQAGGDSLTPMKAQMLTRGIHFVLSPVLMFGWVGLPPMGISGSAVANTVAQVAGAVVNLHALFTGVSRLQLTLKNPTFERGILAQQLKIGAPASYTSGERSLAQLILTGLVAPFGPSALALFVITQRVQMFGSFGAQGLGQACGVIVGQNLGARQPARARATVWWALGYVFAMQGVLCTAMYLFPTVVVSLFSRETSVMDLAVPWLYVEIPAYLFLSLSNVLALMLNTAGDAVIPMVIGIVVVWGIQQPVAHVLTGAFSSLGWSGLNWAVPSSWNLGVLGIPFATLSSSFVRIAALFVYFLKGRWGQKELLGWSRVAVPADVDTAIASASSR